MAGMNAARRAQSLDPLILSRDSSYIGTLLDDLVTKVLLGSCTVLHASAPAVVSVGARRATAFCRDQHRRSRRS